jgi:hypothetical protein
LGAATSFSGAGFSYRFLAGVFAFFFRLAVFPDGGFFKSNGRKPPRHEGFSFFLRGPCVVPNSPFVSVPQAQGFPLSAVVLVEARTAYPSLILGRIGVDSLSPVGGQGTSAPRI